MFGKDRSSTDGTENWAGSRKEWQLIEKVVLANTAELKKQRRWGIFFKLLTFVYLFALLWLFVLGKSFKSDNVPEATGGHTAVVEVRGVIADGEMASADRIYASLQSALNHPDTRAVILRINSPGGSPVQSSYIFNEVRRQRELHPDIPINAVIADTGASGAYYIAASAENIYANGASLVGSIGVTAASFGFEELIERLGIERREFTAGEHKAFLDPFQPVDPEERELFEALLNDVHQQFIEDVRAGRGDRLDESNDKLFSGLVWTGDQAVELGLIDGIKSTSELARELGYPQLVDFSAHLTPWQKFARDLGVGIAQTLVKLGVTEQWQLR
ncbi:peptidase S49 [Saccharospirillum sp. MSK14-1]|uniref:S49 family peptidase n=1 Tax=Saccharospirillum sp. MSK14-1 TaxID=1897632 RepID=UPI000D3638AB|nr:S49 family peptidase [Saccharospirillum sp. MSK14-1]PTY36638.1 peptidase S49 [Saccharospirillum sp. MSK14-1]